MQEDNSCGGGEHLHALHAAAVLHIAQLLGIAGEDGGSLEAGEGLHAEHWTPRQRRWMKLQRTRRGPRQRRRPQLKPLRMLFDLATLPQSAEEDRIAVRNASCESVG
jgi:hypothetical protein